MRRDFLRKTALGVALALTLVETACAHTPQATSVSDAQAAHAKERAASLFNQFVAGKLDRSDFTPEMDKAMTPDLVKQVQQQFAALGALKSLSLAETKDFPSLNGTAFTYTASFSGGDHQIMIFLQKDNKVGGYRVLP